MKFLRFWVTGILATIVLAAALTLLSCDDSDPVGPPDVPEPSPTVFYIGDAYQPHVYRYEVHSRNLDTIVLPNNLSLSWMTLSPDNDSLFVPIDNDMYVVLLDDSARVERVYGDHDNLLAFSDDGVYRAMYGDSVLIIRRSDGAVVFRDTVDVGSGGFTQDSRYFYGISGTMGYTVDLDSANSVELRSLGGGWPAEVYWANSLDRWFLLRSSGDCIWSFDVYDSETGSTIFRQSIQPGWGRFAVNPDETQVLISNPGMFPITFCQSGRPELLVYDIGTNQIQQVISTEGTNTGGDTIDVIGAQMGFSSDGDWVVAAGHAYDFAVISTRDFDVREVVTTKTLSFLALPTAER